MLSCHRNINKFVSVGGITYRLSLSVVRWPQTENIRTTGVWHSLSKVFKCVKLEK